VAAILLLEEQQNWGHMSWDKMTVHHPQAAGYTVHFDHILPEAGDLHVVGVAVVGVVVNFVANIAAKDAVFFQLVQT
jgi:hypothetical protein